MADVRRALRDLHRVGRVDERGYRFIFTDSLSRVAAVSAMLLSRDPHFAAIGFVFTPLTAAVQIPMGLMGHWWPDLLRWNITAVVMSAAFMAGAVIQVRGSAATVGVRDGSPSS